jgi:hypothetical protein
MLCLNVYSKQFITNFTIKALFCEAEIYFKFCSQNAGNAISETQILKFPGGLCPQTLWLTRASGTIGSHLRQSHIREL